MKRLLLGLLLLPFVCDAALAAEKKHSVYASLFYGTASSSSSYGVYDGASGSTMGLDIGFFSGQNFAWDLMIRRTAFDSNSSTVGSVTQTSEMSYFGIGPGFRWFFLHILNLHLGAAYVSSKVSASASVATASVAASGAGSGLGYYYGGGLQVPLGSVDIFADYTIFTFDASVNSNEITGGLRFRF